MIRKGLVFLIIGLIFGDVFSQEINVIDKNTREGIQDVLIYNLTLNNSIHTNSFGVADISSFNKDEVLNFQHPSYHERTISISDLIEMDYKVALEEKIIKIDEVIISASKWEQNPEGIPNMVASMKSKSIAFNNPPNSADLLSQTGQVFMQKSQYGGGSPMIRGFAANSLLLVIDGVRMNNAIYRSGNLQNVISIDVNAIEEAEVLFGPGSVMYGSDAMGGVMDFHTKRIQLNGNDKLSFSGNTFLRYSSAGNEKTGHVDFTLAGKKFGSFTSFSYSDFSDLITGNNRTEKWPEYGKRKEYVTHFNGVDTILKNTNVNKQVFSGYNQVNIIQKFKYRPKDMIDIDYGFYYNNSSNTPRYDRLILYDSEGLPENSEWYYGPQKWMMNKLQARIYQPNKMFSESKFILSHQLVEESRHDRKYKDELLRSRVEKVNIITFNADFDKTINVDHQLFYGLAASYNDVISTAKKVNIITGNVSGTSTRYPDGGSDYSFLALYTNYQWNINDKNYLNAGLRYTWTQLHARLMDNTDLGFEFDNFSNNNRALNGSLGWVHKFTHTTKIDVVASSGFRAPNIDDVGKIFDSEPGRVIVPNKDLKPEYSYNLEAGLTQNLGKNIQFHAVGFYTWLVDAMVRRDHPFNGMDSIYYDGELRKTQSLVNTGLAKIYGFSFSLRGDISANWGIFSSINYTGGRDITEDLPLRHAAPLFGKTSIYYRNKGLSVELITVYSGKKAYDDLAPSEKDKIYLYTPDGALAWYSLNLMSAYMINKTFSVNFGIENILDKHYRTYSSGISAPGRNFIIGFRVIL